MVRALHHVKTMQKSKSFHLQRISENQNHGQTLEGGGDHGAESVSSPEGVGAGQMASPGTNAQSDMELMKERFAKLLLGENMSGDGKGVSSALALSNAITNLADNDDPTENRSTHEHPGSSQARCNATCESLDNFGGQNEFWYGSKDDNDPEERKDDRWWMPTVKVPPNGLSDASRKWMLFQKESVNQVLKAAMAINAQVLSEMAIPEDYIESLPKNGRSSLGELIYKSITVEYFDPEQFLSTMDLSTEHKVLDLKSRIEASIVIWMKKMNSKDAKTPWGSAVSMEKRELFEERAETILLLLKQRFPGIPQSALDISKIQYNRDVGQSILESYSRVIESLAYNVMSRIEDVLEADALAQGTSAREPRNSLTDSLPPAKIPESNTDEEPESLHSTAETPTSMTLSDFMGWGLDKKESKVIRNSSVDNLQGFSADEGDNANNAKNKSSHNITNKMSSYLEKLENFSPLRSPMARHL